MSADISVLVAGGGPAGITAALQAAELGARVTLLEAKICRALGIGRFPQVWSYLGADD